MTDTKTRPRRKLTTAVNLSALPAELTPEQMAASFGIPRKRVIGACLSGALKHRSIGTAGRMFLRIERGNANDYAAKLKQEQDRLEQEKAQKAQEKAAAKARPRLVAAPGTTPALPLEAEPVTRKPKATVEVALLRALIDAVEALPAQIAAALKPEIAAQVERALDIATTPEAA